MQVLDPPVHFPLRKWVRLTSLSTCFQIEKVAVGSPQFAVNPFFRTCGVASFLAYKIGPGKCMHFVVEKGPGWFL